MRLMLAALLLVAITGCGGGGAAAPPVASASPVTTPDPASRPASPVSVSIVSPAAGQTISGTTVHVVVSVSGGRIVQQTSRDIRPDEGHVHLFLDGQLTYMNYTLMQDIPVHPGNYVLRAEFVAADHFPFTPRVMSAQVLFTVA